MPDEKIKRQLVLLKESNEAVVRYLDDTSIALLINRQAVASGTCVNIGSKYFVATAAHNLIGCTKEDVFLIYSKEFSDYKLAITNLGIQGGQPNNPLDIGFIELSKSEALKSRKRFIDLSQLELGVNQKNDDLILVSGYPSDIVKTFKQGNAVSPIGYTTHSSSSAIKQLPAYDIILEYPKDGNAIYSAKISSLPNAYGLSGGGFWLLHINDDGIWSTNSIRLIGIDISWDKKSRWIKGIQIQHWLNFVIQEYPEIKKDVSIATRLRTKFLSNKLFVYVKNHR